MTNGAKARGDDDGGVSLIHAKLRNTTVFSSFGSEMLVVRGRTKIGSSVGAA